MVKKMAKKIELNVPELFELTNDDKAILHAALYFCNCNGEFGGKAKKVADRLEQLFAEHNISDSEQSLGEIWAVYRKPEKGE
jgi:hypothetical protein